jgi:hypothetical protein
MSHSGTRYNPRMAGAPSPQRPVVLHRLGIIKDPNDAFLQESRTQREPQRDALEAFATEADSTPPAAQPLSAVRPLATSSTRLVRRYARFAVIGVVAAGLVAALWAIEEFVRFTLPFAQREAPAAAADTSAAPSTNVATPAPPSRQVQRPRASTANSVGSANDTAQGQQDVRTEGEDAPAPIAAPVPTTLQSGEPDAPPVTETTTVDAPAAPATAAVVDDTIYSEQDRDVVPPYTSEALPGPTISSWTTRTNAMEVIVSETGAVERVRMVRVPQRMPDTFVLSRAKVWKFTPAMKDGRPVRYRLLLTWEVNP